MKESSSTQRSESPGTGEAWSVLDIFPGAYDGQVCNKVIEYFSTIGGSERGREMPDIPPTPAGMSFIHPSVLKSLSTLKKKDSHVEGDPLPHLVRAMPELFAGPVSVIFNKASGPLGGRLSTSR